MGCYRAGVQQTRTEVLSPGLQPRPCLARLTAALAVAHSLCWVEDREINVGPETGAGNCPCGQVPDSQVFTLVPIHFTVFPHICMRNTPEKTTDGKLSLVKRTAHDAKWKS